VTTRRHRVAWRGVVPLSAAAMDAELKLMEGLAIRGFARRRQHLVRWEIQATTPSGPYKLSTCFPAGRLVQFFGTATAALVRQSEIEEMLLLHAQRYFLTHRRCCGGTARLSLASFN
jgi:hypothetical protein